MFSLGNSVKILKILGYFKGREKISDKEFTVRISVYTKYLKNERENVEFQMTSYPHQALLCFLVEPGYTDDLFKHRLIYKSSQHRRHSGTLVVAQTANIFTWRKCLNP